MKKVAILIDGGYLRVVSQKLGLRHTPELIESVARSCAAEDEEIYRILYYDCAPFSGEVKLPVSGRPHKFESSDEWLNRLSRKELFAVRRGVLKFRGFKPRRVPVTPETLKDEDFKPDFEQKGVDMRIGLDIATFCQNGAVERIVLVSADTDCIPAMKHGRKAGLQVVIIQLQKQHLAPELLSHADFCRAVGLPALPGTHTGENSMISGTEVKNALDKIEGPLRKYCWIQERVHRCDVRKDDEFQRRFNGFYRVRRGPKWQECFYDLLETAKQRTIAFPEALSELQRRTGRFEAVFASKLVATLDPTKPVIDAVVLGHFGMCLPAYTSPSRESKTIEAYNELARKLRGLLESGSGKLILDAFRLRYPLADVTNLKKIDLVLWQIRE